MYIFEVDIPLEAASTELVVQTARVMRALRRTLGSNAYIRTLSILDEGGPLTITALAESDFCSQPTMTGIVQTLASKGFVTKARNPKDARSNLVTLTDAGRTRLAEFRSDHGRAVATALTGRRSAAEVRAAVAVMSDVLENLTLERKNP